VSPKENCHFGLKRNISLPSKQLIKRLRRSPQKKKIKGRQREAF
jgi:hypothetical protein